MLPAVDRGMDATIKLEEKLFGLSGRDERRDDPDKRGDAGSNQRSFGEHHGIVAGEMNARKRKGHDERCDHGRDFTPRVDAPPIPAKQQNAAGACAHAKKKLPSCLNGIDVRGGVAA